MTYGPIDFLAVEFGSSDFSPEMVDSLLELVEHKLIRIIDLVVVAKDADGVVSALEVEQLDENTLALFEPLDDFVNGMVAIQDIELIGEMLENDSRAALMLFENLWAVKFKEAIMHQGGQVLMQERIPHEVVIEALVELAEMD